MESVFRMLYFGQSQMRNRHKALYHIIVNNHINQNALGNKFADFAPDFRIDGKPGGKILPGVAPELFDAQGNAMQSAVDGKDYGFHVLILFKYFLGMVDAFCPADIRDVNQSVNAFLDFDKGAESG